MAAIRSGDNRGAVVPHDALPVPKQLKAMKSLLNACARDNCLFTKCLKSQCACRFPACAGRSGCPPCASHGSVLAYESSAGEKSNSSSAFFLKGSISICSMYAFTPSPWRSRAIWLMVPKFPPRYFICSSIKIQQSVGS